MADLILKGKVIEIDLKEKDNKRFIFLENGRNSEQVSVPTDFPVKLGDTVELNVRNFNGITKTGRPWQFYASI